MENFYAFDEFLNEAVSISEVRPYVRAWEESGGRKRYADWFNNKFRIYLPIKEKSNIQIKVETILDENGYEIISYQNNKAVKTDAADKTRNHTKITKLLQRFNKELLAEYNHDKDTEADTEHIIVISRHPYDIVGMTTDREWHSQSCMEIRDGAYREKVIEDVKHGSLVAYAIKKDDTNVKNPIGRLLIKPFENKDGDTILATDRRVYGTELTGFRDTIEEWLDTKQTSVKGVYNLKRPLYDDGKHIVFGGFKDASPVAYTGGMSYYKFKKIGKWGLASEEGEVVIEPIYDEISYAVESSLCVTLKGKKGHVNIPDGSIVIPIQYNDIKMFGYGYWGIKGDNDKWSVAIFNNGEEKKLCLNMFDDISMVDTSGGIMRVTLKGKVGIYRIYGGMSNPQLKQVLAAKYDYITKDGGYFTIGIKSGSTTKVGMLDSDALEILPPIYDTISINRFKGVLLPKLNGLTGVYDNTGKEIIPIKFNQVFVDTDHITCYVESGIRTFTGALYTTKGEMLISLEDGCSNIYRMNDGEFYRVSKENGRITLYGLYDTKRKEFALPMEYSYISHYVNTTFWVETPRYEEKMYNAAKREFIDND
jgi:hypothetical protein